MLFWSRLGVLAGERQCTPKDVLKCRCIGVDSALGSSCFGVASCPGLLCLFSDLRGPNGKGLRMAAWGDVLKDRCHGTTSTLVSNCRRGVSFPEARSGQRGAAGLRAAFQPHDREGPGEEQDPP
jgi:hypothetical protein